ncbi:NAD(P)-dependent dehydrogenase (short-subunit alcohol dehydrogenase family) [Actinomycetospora succinea]|uniref:NAD(P)-dependent dehydrogenase (Short-subunit alcohol dehydrogenase family) n=1 Tax=Actinomycetospora succinea TaxID=663603 RepID=A0A4R6VQM2_9PSEU|nr:SDR family NAD(P)-dependent oxidoreductase [Actinomycetospora succinea]TDQ64826.1 NAD(P)-dependent dehydrogenase (short-subunit alcohol dehydrogenase family) [Actinomycetospora succinea]
MTDYQKLFDLRGRRALLLGAGGIGREAGLALAAQGAEVVCADRDPDTAKATADAIAGEGGLAGAVELDITDAGGLERHLGEVGDLDVAVLTAAMNVRKRLLDYSPEEFDRVVGLNLRGTFNVLRAVGARMVARGSGSIIAFSSIRARTVEPGQGVYAATKAGLESLVRTAAVEFGEAGVRVNAVAPGVVETPLTAQIKADPDWYRAYATKGALGRWSLPSELAGAVVYLASDASSYVTGSTLSVDGGWTAVDGRFTPPA